MKPILTEKFHKNMFSGKYNQLEYNWRIVVYYNNSCVLDSDAAVSLKHSDNNSQFYFSDTAPCVSKFRFGFENVIIRCEYYDQTDDLIMIWNDDKIYSYPLTTVSVKFPKEIITIH